MTHRSSTTPAIPGSSSETSVPQAPRRANFQGLARSFLLARLMKLYTTSPLYSRPWCRASSGLGSSRSTCEGPPCMNSEIIAVALGANRGARGFRSIGRFSPGFPGASASRPSWRRRWARANDPTPKAEFDRKARRFRSGGSIHMEELVGNQELLAEVRQNRQLAVAAGVGLAVLTELLRDEGTRPRALL